MKLVFSVALILLSLCALVVSRMPPDMYCPSGVPAGRRCSPIRSCTPGYYCYSGRCCPDSCPRGWISDGPCNTQIGEQRCRFGYDCINNFCCKRIVIIDPPNNCPIGQIQVPGTCLQGLTCPYGSTCYGGMCCRYPVTY